MLASISRVYEHYKTPLRLRHHMLRVAGVAQIICENWRGSLDTKSVITAMLVHDLSKIVSIPDSSLIRESSKEDDKPSRYWLNLKREYIERYGSEEHMAVFNMANEMGLSQRASHLALNIFLENATLPRTKDSELKVCVYSDLRVSPSSVTTLDERIKDVEKRYAVKYPRETVRILHKIEDEIRAHTRSDPSSITEKEVAPKIKKLEGFRISISSKALSNRFEVSK
ncbi:MAG: hypothetical protein KGH61_03940 [Candidatus Micrarchaeota archaeon]|nr:hypothetical protein [Candidatus Micrarchaeota archaeon]MDE1848071.1 hypothetical protein [Candidatus Micrarchaeota archaeon]MDE1864874.1 hypothetical protein [Candidatus Micrarchaeota archaeon]